MALGSSCQKEWQRQLRREGLGLEQLAVSESGSHHFCQLLAIFAHQDSEKSFYPLLALCFLPFMAFPGTPVQELFPIRRPGNGPPGLRARHIESMGG